MQIISKWTFLSIRTRLNISHETCKSLTKTSFSYTRLGYYKIWRRSKEHESVCLGVLNKLLSSDCVSFHFYFRARLKELIAKSTCAWNYFLPWEYWIADPRSYQFSFWFVKSLEISRLTCASRLRLLLPFDHYLSLLLCAVHATEQIVGVVIC